MAFLEVTFYRSTPRDNQGLNQLVGASVGTFDTETLSAAAAVGMSVPANATIAVFTPPVDMRVRSNSFGDTVAATRATGPSPTGSYAIPPTATPSVSHSRLFKAGVTYYIGVAGGGNLSILQEA